MVAVLTIITGMIRQICGCADCLLIVNRSLIQMILKLMHGVLNPDQK
jgi:hypothetical protein